MFIDVNIFFNCRPIYRYMPRSIFDALEAGYKAGKYAVEVDDAEFIKMKSLTPVELWPDIAVYGPKLPKA